MVKMASGNPGAVHPDQFAFAKNLRIMVNVCGFLLRGQSRRIALPIASAPPD
jgi:hypothetical protein